MHLNNDYLYYIYYLQRKAPGFSTSVCCSSYIPDLMTRKVRHVTSTESKKKSGFSRLQSEFLLVDKTSRELEVKLSSIKIGKS